MLRKGRVDGPAQVPDSFAMDDSDPQDGPGAAFGEVIRDDALDIGRAEGVQIEHAIDGQLDWFGAAFVWFIPAVHGLRINSKLFASPANFLPRTVTNICPSFVILFGHF